ncbi:MAG: hypothetical protein A2Y65_11615 [Deltaproteobacteria bacterium RBG_13_52_11]|nr:MAG: hypothetical protein A2Y65_11615 [Deltaproteobacteria bacterium RBG_13_52_11]
MMYMARINALRKMFFRVASVLLAVLLLVAQASTILANPQATCVPGAGSLVPSASSQAHQCCCGEVGSCCCDVQQGATAALPDMAFAAISGGEYYAPPLYAASATGLQISLLTQALKSVGRWTGTGPPLTLSYLVNLTFRC